MKTVSGGKKVLVFVVLVLIILSFNFFKDGVRGFFYFISAPVQNAVWWSGDKTSDFFNLFHTRNYFQKEIAELNLEKQELLSDIVFLQELKRENEVLREALNMGLQLEFSLDIAEIISKDVSQDFVLINKGKLHGVSEGMAVITSGKVLCGKVVELYLNLSKVMLLTSEESSFDARVSDKEISGVVKGKGSFKISLELVLQEDDLKEGDLVITSAFGGVYPSGLLVGKVSKVKTSDIEPFQQAEISPFLNINEIEHLFIIK